MLRTLGSSRKFADAPQHAGRLGEFAQLLYNLLVPHTDDFGRMSGDAFTVKHAVFPTSPRKETEFVAALSALRAAGLIQWYVVPDGRQVIQIVDFGKGQPNLHKKTASGFPEYSEDFPEVPGNSRTSPEVPAQLNSNELNSTKENLHTRGRVPVDVERVQGFIDRYRDFHQRFRGVPYLGNDNTNYQEACTLVANFPDAMLDAITVHWLNVPDDKFTEGRTRTIAQLRSRASKYAEELKARRLA